MKTTDATWMGGALLLAVAASVGWDRLGPHLGPDSGGSPAATPAVPAVSGIARATTRLPVAFVANHGQWEEGIRFRARVGGVTAFLTDHGFAVQLLQRQGYPTRGRRLHDDRLAQPEPLLGVHLLFTFEGSRERPQIAGVDELPGRYHFFFGNDPSRWRRHVPSFRRVRHRDLYPGIDLEVYERERRLEYDLALEPGADLREVVVRCEGARALRLEADGTLVVETDLGEVRQAPPRTWEVGPPGERRAVACRYVLLDEERYGFKVRAWSGTRPLLIDPSLAYSTYLGSPEQDIAYDIAVDSEGSAFIVGESDAPVGFPVTPGAFASEGAVNGNGFVTKLAPGGDALVYSTYIGGTSTVNEAYGVEVDEQGFAYLAGTTTSSDFPVTPEAFDTTHNGNLDFYALKLNADGSDLVYSTFVGGSDWDFARDMALGPDGSVYVCGETKSPDMPATPGALKTQLGGPDDAFVCRLLPDGSGLAYGTYLGGDNNLDEAFAIAVDSSGCAYVTGRTSPVLGESNFPVTPSAFDRTYNGGLDTFVAKLSADGSSLVYGTYLGGSDYEWPWGIAVDAAGAAYVTGQTESMNFPSTPGAYDPTFNSNDDVFVTKLHPTGRVLEYSTALGMLAMDESRAIAIDSGGRAYVVGQTTSAYFPVTPDALQATHQGGILDAFLARFDASGSVLEYATYLGGSTGTDRAWGGAVDGDGSVYITGQTVSSDFPTTPGTFDTDLSGFSDGWVAKVDLSPWEDLGQGLAGTGGVTPTLFGEGSLQAGSSGMLTLSDTLPGAPSTLVLGFTQLGALFKGGTLVPAVDVLLPWVADGQGQVLLPWTQWPGGLPAGFELFFQYWIVDPGGPKGFSASNALLAVLPTG